MEYIGIIPARYASTRFPGKPLAMIHGQSMIQRVYGQASACSMLSKVIVATDDQRIFDHVSSFGQVIMTSSRHQSGTDRCLEALRIITGNSALPNDTVVINIQGDEPFIQPRQISQLAEAFNDDQTQIASLVKKIESSEELFDENIVKVVFSNTSEALYFSRHPLPFIRNVDPCHWLKHADYFKHLGIYAYTAQVLEKIANLPAGKYEKAEALEQLRWLEHGFKISLRQTSFQSMAVDTPEDLQKILNNPAINSLDNNWK
jgi:3-deoxy-manno-octulosonate cytidylyltransferase (CMP-KDO synthetase)